MAEQESAVVLSYPFPLSLLVNGPLISALISFCIAQLTKFLLTYAKSEQIDWSRLWGSGGMPSSHTAFVSGLAMAVCVKEGADSSMFAVTVVIAAIVSYDATGVRLHAGRQASVLNALMMQLPPEHPVQDHEFAGRLKEQLGHSPVEVLVGGLLGMVVGLLVQTLFNHAAAA